MAKILDVEVFIK